MYRPKEEEQVMVHMGKGETAVGKLKHVQPSLSMALIELPSGQMVRCPLHRVRSLNKPRQRVVEAAAPQQRGQAIPVTMEAAQQTVGHLYHHIDTQRMPLFKRFLRKMKLSH